ncbi:AzlD domain-containing protein [Protaetiibacter sp. SSC-01]|uniref:AzlD domain-containing protein n=1 Tax=Protaetiibacter sp. SSC-01 TaxID=2759943 RepID=UPI001657571C|nr:AzlD domain-containing protein [Protaetiibacter sp. SSC-01]QNO38676.1 AzlD domain-containing protein [Protaetiibacter sp. SSC-01]
MTVWHVILLASIAVFALKLVGYLVPPSLLERPTPARVANLLTVALLAALTATQTLESAGGIVLDARVPAVVLAAALYALRVPFIVVVIAAAALAALVRLLGWMP